MFQGVKNAGGIFKGSIKAVAMHPALLAPLLFVWLIYAPSILYLQFFFPWDALSGLQTVAVVFGFILCFSLALSLSCFWLLELIRRIEAGEPKSFIASFTIAVRNVLRALHVTMLWALIWLVLSLLSALFSRKNEEEDQSFSAENAARTLSGAGSFSLSGAFFDALNKGVRMVAFLIFPAIAWETSPKPIKRGLQVARTHPTEFASGFLLTEIASAVVFLPPALLFYIVDEAEITLSDGVWYLVIVYCAFAWSISILLEQLFTAELYLWDMKWRKACEAAQENGDPEPVLNDVSRPSILDDIKEFDGAMKAVSS